MREFNFSVVVEEMILLLIVPINGGKMMLADAKDKLVTATIEAVALPVMVEVIDKVLVVVIIGNGENSGSSVGDNFSDKIVRDEFGDTGT